MISRFPFFSAMLTDRKSKAVAVADAVGIARKTQLFPLYCQLENQHKKQLEALKKNDSKGLCSPRRMWAYLHALLLLMEGGCASMAAWGLSVAIANDPENPDASLWNYNYLRQDNDLTCTEMFDSQKEDNNCGASFSGTVADLCAGTFDYPTNFPDYIKPCTDILDDCCVAKKQARAELGSGLGTLLFFIALVTHLCVCCRREAHTGTSSLTKNQKRILSDAGIISPKENTDTPLSLMKKIEPLMIVEIASYQENSNATYTASLTTPTDLLGEIHRFYSSGHPSKKVPPKKVERNEDGPTLTEIIDDGRLERPLLQVTGSGP